MTSCGAVAGRERCLMPPLYAPRKQVPGKLVPDIVALMSPDGVKAQWEFVASLRALAVLRGDLATVMECEQRMEQLLDYPAI